MHMTVTERACGDTAARLCACGDRKRMLADRIRLCCCCCAAVDVRFGIEVVEKLAKLPGDPAVAAPRFRAINAGGTAGEAEDENVVDRR